MTSQCDVGFGSPKGVGRGRGTRNAAPLCVAARARCALFPVDCSAWVLQWTRGSATRIPARRLEPYRSWSVSFVERMALPLLARIYRGYPEGNAVNGGLKGMR